MESLLREEVVLLLATLVAFGVLLLGTLEFLWPTRGRPAGRRAGAAGPAVPPARRETAPVEDRAAVALRVGRALLARALEDPEPGSDRQVRLLCLAIACLERGRNVAPGDARLQEARAAAHEALATADQRTAVRWLAAAMPWRAPEPARVPAGAGAR